MKKWEYKTESYVPSGFVGGKVNLSEFNNELNRLGHEGWELVNAVSVALDYGRTRKILIIFKREIYS